MPESEERRWAGYSDYQNVASQLHEDINRAVKAYSHIDSKGTQNIGITPQTAVKTRSAILGITKRLFFEIERNKNVDDFGEIYRRWEGEGDDEGYVARLENSDFTREVPPWLGQLVDDIITAGWELGYIKAGVEKPAAPESDENQVKEMFE